MCGRVRPRVQRGCPCPGAGAEHSRRAPQDGQRTRRHSEGQRAGSHLAPPPPAQPVPSPRQGVTLSLRAGSFQDTPGSGNRSLVGTAHLRTPLRQARTAVRTLSQLPPPPGQGGLRRHLNCFLPGAELPGRPRCPGSPALTSSVLRSGSGVQRGASPGAEGSARPGHQTSRSPGARPQPTRLEGGVVGISHPL